MLMARDPLPGLVLAIVLLAALPEVLAAADQQCFGLGAAPPFGGGGLLRTMRRPSPGSTPPAVGVVKAEGNEMKGLKGGFGPSAAPGK